MTKRGLPEWMRSQRDAENAVQDANTVYVDQTGLPEKLRLVRDRDNADLADAWAALVERTKK